MALSLKGPVAANSARNTLPIFRKSAAVLADQQFMGRSRFYGLSAAVAGGHALWVLRACRYLWK
jgi:hypothetical protein